MYFHIASIKVVSVTASLDMRVTVCVSASLLGPCCWRTGQAVPNKRAQGGLLWQQLLGCAALSVCLCAVSWPCRADRPSSHGAGSSCVLCCRSGSLSHRSVVNTVSCHEQPQQHQQLPQKSSFSFSFSVCLLSFFSTLFSFPTTKCSSLSPSLTLHYLLCFPNLHFSELFFSSTVSLACLSFSVCLHSPSVQMDVVSTENWSSARHLEVSNTRKAVFQSTVCMMGEDFERLCVLVSVLAAASLKLRE